MVSGVTVVTVSRGRPKFLRRAIESVRAQQCRVPIQHHIIVDQCEQTHQYLLDADDLPSHLQWDYIDSLGNVKYTPARLGRLRNIGADTATTSHIAFLDDDNEFDSSHLDSLVQVAEASGNPAAHSARQLFHRDGRPYLREEWPWGDTLDERKRRYRRYHANGIVKPGSHITFDRCDPRSVTDPVRNVDTSEWLFDRGLFLDCSFPETYTADERSQRVFEDEKLQERLLDAGIEPISTRCPTLRYYLGGYSNDSE